MLKVTVFLASSVSAIVLAVTGVANAATPNIPTSGLNVQNLNGNVLAPVTVDTPVVNIPRGAAEVTVQRGAVEIQKGAVNLQMVMPSPARSSGTAALTPTAVTFDGFSLSRPKGVEWFVEASVSGGVVPYSTHGDLAGAASGSVSAGIRGNIGGGLSMSEKIAQANALLKSELATVKMLEDADEPESAIVLKNDALGRFFKVMKLK